MKIEMVGRKFGRLTVVAESGRIGRKHAYDCVCNCGGKKRTVGDYLRAGLTQSCGCIQHEILLKRNSTHGLSKHPLYGVWCAMHTRCSNKNTRAYKWYGAAGITVCKRWNSFAIFHKDMLAGWSDGLTLDRIDGTKGYSKGNCRWVTQKEQVNNTSKNVFVDFLGKRKTVAQWSEIVGISQGTIHARIGKLNWPSHLALTVAVGSVRNGQYVQRA